MKKDKRRSRKKVSSTDPESGYMKRPGNTELFSLDMLSCLWRKDPNKSLRRYDT